MIRQYINELEKELSLPSLATDVPDVYTLPLEEVVVTITVTARGFHLKANLAPVPNEREGEFLASALYANLLGEATSDSVLGINGNQLTLSRVIDYNIDYKMFSEIIEDFANSADFWRKEALGLV